jgi:Tfp pilus assembly protein PilX
MNTTRPHPQRGWTLWETLIGISIIALLALTFSRVFNSSERLATETRTRHRAEESLRRNLEALANVLRDADVGTLDGFDSDGESTNPSFARITNVDATGPVYSPVEELRWTSSSASVPGVVAPGRVVHVRNGTERLVANNVPSGGFSVVRQAGALVLRVQTYYAVNGHLEWAQGTTAVALRN